MSIYALVDPRTGAHRYVGQSRYPNTRYRAHVRQRSHSERLRGWVAELATCGLAPRLEILGPGSEREWVERLQPDLNAAPGEDGDVVPHGQGLDVEIKIRVSAEDKLRFEAAARVAMTTLSNWARIQLNAAAGHTQKEKKAR